MVVVTFWVKKMTADSVTVAFEPNAFTLGLCLPDGTTMSYVGPGATLHANPLLPFVRFCVTLCVPLGVGSGLSCGRTWRRRNAPSGLSR